MGSEAEAAGGSAAKTPRVDDQYPFPAVTQGPIRDSIAAWELALYAMVYLHLTAAVQRKKRRHGDDDLPCPLEGVDFPLTVGYR